MPNVDVGSQAACEAGWDGGGAPKRLGMLGWVVGGSHAIAQSLSDREVALMIGTRPRFLQPVSQAAFACAMHRDGGGPCGRKKPPRQRRRQQLADIVV
jgi:hypothetical protein